MSFFKFLDSFDFFDVMLCLDLETDQSVSSPEAIAGPTPLTLQSACIADWRSFVF